MPEAPLDLSRIVKAYDVRGLSPEQLDPVVARALGAAAADVLGVAGGGGAMVVGHDMRPTSPGLVDAFARGVTDRGGDVLVIGLCSTDGLYFASGSLDAPGAMFTASHNPAAYNGIKLCREGARPVGQESGLAQVRDLAQAYLDPAGDGVPPAPRPGARTERDLLGEYAAHLRSLVPLGGIRPLRVVVDAGNGMAGLTAPAVLGTAAGLPALPLDVVPLYFELDGSFPNHEANPLEPENLRDLQAAVREHGADLGLAFDGDADRCFVVDERGQAVSPSAVTALVALRELAREGGRGTVLHNLITSRAVPELVERAGGTPVRTRVGHSFIKAEMARTGAVFGGEHSAHYYFRDFWGADTGMLAALHVLAALGEQERPLSQLLAEHDPYAASGEINSRVDDVAAITRSVEEAWTARGGRVDDLDGLTVSSPPGEEPSWWFNLRPSNTEPLLRLNVEGADEATMASVRDAVLAQVRGGAA
ncbi:phosphomannomutase/phosphoglucomutase [Quadrisphaera sp. DSM 44207]|uniref:phosphomannomutase/phosphoglucomutase n=1 Tax=Quadrisphaera sp. DSM 44207 TaxID=1881057 RepID=UPI0008910BD8|nr:phosphomannomutase/phosphoglucomutase [Quadrisphaera sp. DSM 44207]SDQ09352.1 phosphomannomutase [Quadrisphaera sp. DSM 44207]